MVILLLIIEDYYVLHDIVNNFIQKTHIIISIFNNPPK